MPSYVAQAIAGGSDDYDTKPVNFERLFGKIQAILKK
jgi:DNA-binding response OmpR family regulator